MGLLRFLAGREARAVVDLLDNDPEGWSDCWNPLAIKPFDICHKSGVTLWVANDTYGCTAYTGHHVSGVTMLSTAYLSPRHHLLWGAYKRWRRAHPFKGAPPPQSVLSAIAGYRAPKSAVSRAGEREV